MSLWRDIKGAGFEEPRPFFCSTLFRKRCHLQEGGGDRIEPLAQDILCGVFLEYGVEFFLAFNQNLS